MPKVLYEDNHIIAVYKPAGLLTQPDSSGDRSLMDEVKKYLKDKNKKPGNAFLGLVHRLDRNVFGIVLFGKTSKGASRLSEQFRNHEIKKIYHAVVEGELTPKNGKLIHFSKKDEAQRKAIVLDLPKEGYDKMELDYEVIRSNKKYSLVKINLKTGRFHQIRAQFSAIGHPIVGDKKYKAKDELSGGLITLCATEVEFKMATTDEIKNIKIDYPKEWLSYFN
ncbi:MAG: RNA pseudouridine synthase [bacterium]|nr:RNA pseudouridine synthase [bacterium]